MPTKPGKSSVVNVGGRLVKTGVPVIKDRASLKRMDPGCAKDGDEVCGKRYLMPGGFEVVCTRVQKHEGMHVAHQGLDGDPLIGWWVD